MCALVRDQDKAWHAGKVNGYTLGIEIEDADVRPGMPEIQERLVVQQINFYLKKYNINPRNITIHRWHAATSCPGWIWKTDDDFLEWRKKWWGV